jgi:predicted MFS family arabinose efflux permease
MIAADWARALLIATIPLAALAGMLSLPQLYLVAATVCMASVMFDIADHAFLPVLVGSERLVTANSRRETIDALAEISGPPLGGLLVQWLTAAVAMAIDALSFVVSALFIARIRTREPAPEPLARTAGAQGDAQPAASLFAEARAGAALVLADPLLRALFFATMLMTLATSLMAPLYTLFALETLHLGPGLLGLVIGAGGIGALAGAALTPRLVARVGQVATARISLLLGGLAQLFIPLAPPDPATGALFLVASQLFGDALLTIYLVTEVSLRQRSIPQAALGRAAALWKTAHALLAPIGMLAGALVAERFGVRVAMWCIVGGVLVASVPLLKTRKWRPEAAIG